MYVVTHKDVTKDSSTEFMSSKFIPMTRVIKAIKLLRYSIITLIYNVKILMVIEFSIDYFSDQFLKTKCTEKKKNLRNVIKFDLIHCIKKKC